MLGIFKRRVNMTGKSSTARYKPVKNLNTAELKTEIEVLPAKITEAREVRNRMWRKLRERWSESFVNSAEFVTVSNQAEAAGKEYMTLLYRLVQANRLYNERTSGRLGEEV